MKTNNPLGGSWGRGRRAVKRVLRGVDGILEGQDPWWGPQSCGQLTHRAACLVVVLVHCRAGIGSVFPCIRKLPRHQHPEVGILAAAAPFPAFSRWPLMMRVAAANGGGTLGAGARDREGYPSRGDGVHEG